MSVSTDGSSQSLPMPPKATGQGSGINGGEFLMLALATCYCNDLYREAQRMGLSLSRAEVEATAEFAGVGLAASHIRYRAHVESPASAEQIAELIRHTDAVAEVHNTIRAGVPVVLAAWRPPGMPDLG
ncbi:OsmC family protein [Ideonella sp.]|uniref:OsmC family protein n=1 Tax=Ideonella sp. TaxID=1929293 RepID=UPI0035AE2B5B